MSALGCARSVAPTDSRILCEVAEHTRTCPYCGTAYQLPPDYVSGKNLAFQTVHPNDRNTRRPTGQVIIMVANVRVHECWHKVPPAAQR